MVFQPKTKVLSLNLYTLKKEKNNEEQETDGKDLRNPVGSIYDDGWAEGGCTGGTGQ